MTSRRTTLKYTPYAAAFVLALFLRLLNLGALPLSDFEARWALQALGIAQGAKPLLGSNSAYSLLTAAVFFLFGATNFLARFWPAVAGSLLALSPGFFRSRLGRLPSLLLAFGLALDPGLLALSRQAGGGIFAITFLALTFALWNNRRFALAGVCAGLALLSGPSVWFGLATILLAWAVWQVRPSPPKKKEEEQAQPDKTEADAVAGRFDWNNFKKVLLWAAGTLLLGGTLFFLSPNGLSASVSALPEFVRGWWNPSGVRSGWVALALPAYELMPLIFGLIAVVRGALSGDRLSVRLGIWALAALLLALVYPARQVGDLAWAHLPLWTLAALELGRHLDWREDGRKEALIVAALMLVILIFSWISFSGAPDAWNGSDAGQVRLGLALGALLLLGLSLLLVAMGWSADVARRGAAWGGMAALLIFTLGMGTGAAGLRRPVTVELWQSGPSIAQADLLLLTADQVSDWNTGYANSLQVSIIGVDSPALRWVLRDYDVQVADSLAVNATPPLVITPADRQLMQPSSYRGQDFVWQTSPVWDYAPASVWARWLVFRSMPQTKVSIVLWVRNDLMPGGTEDGE